MKHFWDEKKTIQLTKLVIVLFFVAMLAVDFGAFGFVQFLCGALSKDHGQAGFTTLLLCLYLCSVPMYCLLFDLYHLLCNLQAGQVFIPQNVKHLRRASWCCFAAAIICLGGLWYWPSLLLVSIAAAFVALIIRVIKNIFDQAIGMKTELDFTV